MADHGAHYEFRDRLVELVIAEMVGPVAGEGELLHEPPTTAYLAGVLHPRQVDHEIVRVELDEADADVEQVVVEDVAPDVGVSLANRQRPSSMGMTFAVDTTAVATVEVQVSAGHYDAVDAAGEPVAAMRQDARGTDDDGTRQWKRRRIEIAPISVDVRRAETWTIPVAAPLELRIRVREPDETGASTITLTLVNDGRPTEGLLVDPECFLQVGMRVETDVPALLDRTAIGARGDAEQRLTRLLHRHAPRFAGGHGCAVGWSWTAPAPGEPLPAIARTDALWTTVTPVHEVLLSDSNPDGPEIAMLELADSPNDRLFALLGEMLAGYEAWIGARVLEAAGFAGTPFAEQADGQIALCREALARMSSGMELLRRDPLALTAFRDANRAMATQRARTSWIKNERQGTPEPAKGKWRPFQLGFFLLCLDGIADREHADRDLADVLWFPTGGGKTEAYLALIAFTAFLRRRRLGVAGGGVTVLMRYTLRLLTLQQFERAAALICAMELMRRADPALGGEHFTIGMWVGKAATPNQMKDAKASLDALAKDEQVREQNPVQLTACPWCGEPFDHRAYFADVEGNRLTITCPAAKCEFAAGLPVLVVDEEIYERRPTLVIATADKFAQIAWRDTVADLFNRREAPAGTPPPDLVIQDELHLISGPLGTLAGLYEAAVDVAAERPKIVASTATIRRADDQGRALFDRSVRQFPPAALDSRDSWFALEAPRERKATRAYLGLLAPATSQATLSIRAYAALLHHAATIPGDDAVRDAYWTLISYFTSLRLLSAAELQVRSDVVERLDQLALRDGVEPRGLHLIRELTSRIDSTEVPSHLRELSEDLPGGGALDVVLATNMISVGVDIDRLGLMAMTGQPQTTAEYIQASSRVGRRDPGLVVMLFNAARSRDRSHFEDFVSYHSALYRQVESTSVTPFSARARDRALRPVLVGLVRLMTPMLRSNEAAARVEDFEDDVQAAVRQILDRVASIAPEEVAAAKSELEHFVNGWVALASRPSLSYEAKRRRLGQGPRDRDAALLRAYGQDDDLIDATEAMWSLRDVDVEVPLLLER